jgi:hypothetical protein
MIRTEQIPNLGMKNDRKHCITKARIDNDTCRANVDKARQAIYVKNRPVDSDPVEDLLKEESYVPTKVCWVLSDLPIFPVVEFNFFPMKNAFSERLSSFPNFNLFDLFVVDFMHEVELGVWRSLFIHPIRILHAVNPALIHELDLRQA